MAEILLQSNKPINEGEGWAHGQEILMFHNLCETESTVYYQHCVIF